MRLVWTVTWCDGDICWFFSAFSFIPLPLSKHHPWLLAKWFLPIFLKVIFQEEPFSYEFLWENLENLEIAKILKIAESMIWQGVDFLHHNIFKLNNRPPKRRGITSCGAKKLFCPSQFLLVGEDSVVLMNCVIHEDVCVLRWVMIYMHVINHVESSH